MPPENPLSLAGRGASFVNTDIVGQPYRASRTKGTGVILRRLGTGLKGWSIVMIGRIAFAGAIALSMASPATAATRAYDGSWALSIVTDRGGCDRSYDFNVQIADGNVYHPN